MFSNACSLFGHTVSHRRSISAARVSLQICRKRRQTDGMVIRRSFPGCTNSKILASSSFESVVSCGERGTTRLSMPWVSPAIGDGDGGQMGLG